MSKMSEAQIGPAEAFQELEQGMYVALETYSNVHRGSGHKSMISTHLYEQAREIVLEYLGLGKHQYVVIFCTPARAEALVKRLEPGSFHKVSSQDAGLSLGVRALAVQRKALPRGVPFQTGGGTTKMISKEWEIWADAPDRFEAGTPAIINIIAFARALRMMHKYGKNIFFDRVAEEMTATGILYHDELEKNSGRELLEELRSTMIGRSVRVPTIEGDSPFINFDNSASTPAFGPVWNAFRQAWRQSEQVQQEIIREVKTICSGLFGAPEATYEVIFTSNTTEAINLTAESTGRASHAGMEPVVVNTLLEHSSNDLPWRMIPGCTVIRLPVDMDGFFDLNELERIMCAYNRDSQFGKKQVRMVAVSGASNVLGTCNDIAAVSRIVHRYGAQFLVDAAQLVAHRRVDMERDGIDFLAFSAHKIYAPFGCGVLVARKGLLSFNDNELAQIRSSGEENAGGIAALGKALVLLKRVGMEVIREEEQALTVRLLTGMKKVPGLRLYGIKDPDSKRFSEKLGVVVFDLKGRMPSRVAKELAMRGGIGVRYGCHCAHIIIKHILGISPFLERFQWLIQKLFPKFRFLGLVRVSLGIGNTEQDVDFFLTVLNKMAGHSQNAEARHIPSKMNETTILTTKEVERQMDDFAKTAGLRVYDQP